MRPEIANLLKKDIYPFLKDHESVHGRPSVLGVEKNLFFVDHNHPEEVCNLTTRKNKHEAKFLVAFARYLVQNGHKTSEIVILATYTGQIQELEALAKNQPHLRGVKISTLDGFQGQEADIVLLSLVRSDGIGFLAEANRICVALSRARNGFYIVGNMKLLSRSSELWYNIQRCLKSQNSIGRALALRCQTHQTITEVESPDDFSLVQSGGCCKTCRATLPCGHVCFLVCHTNRAAHLCENKCKPYVLVNCLRDFVFI
jgi:helicase required for RNAi-mediated heterochromatin assembly 1